MNSHSVSVDRVIDAPPAEIFALLADAGRHQSFDGSGSVQGTRNESEPLELGTTFGMSMKMGFAYKTANTVIEFERDRLIAWQTRGFGGFIGGRIWRYELIPVEQGTHVIETWDISQDKQRFLLKHSNFPAMTRKNMTETLERISQALA
ncbi:MAG: Dimethyladenosine transferase methylation [Nocardioidaceae bacterium]|nr:Dimethyladenosine transferase methylation [Nocardioidaceae bacterium]